MNVRQAWMRRVAVCLGVVLFAAACSLLPGTSSIPSVLADENFGKAQGRACVKNGNPWTQFVCKGHPPRDFADGLDDANVIDFLDNKIKWEQPSAKFKRLPANGTVQPEMRIQSVRDPERFVLADHNDTAYVMARIIASPRAAKDRRYNIGGDPNSTLDDYFYVVVRGFIPDDFTPPADTVHAGPSRPISNWTIYGIDRGEDGPRLKEISSGVVRWCLHPHKKLQRDRQASFAYCSKTANTMEMSIRRFAPLQSDFDPPAWFTCGIGCCVADRF